MVVTGTLTEFFAKVIQVARGHVDAGAFLFAGVVLNDNLDAGRRQEFVLIYQGTSHRLQREASILAGRNGHPVILPAHGESVDKIAPVKVETALLVCGPPFRRFQPILDDTA